MWFWSKLLLKWMEIPKFFKPSAGRQTFPYQTHTMQRQYSQNRLIPTGRPLIMANNNASSPMCRSTILNESNPEAQSPHARPASIITINNRRFIINSNSKNKTSVNFFSNHEEKSTKNFSLSEKDYKLEE